MISKTHSPSNFQSFFARTDAEVVDPSNDENLRSCYGISTLIHHLSDKTKQKVVKNIQEEPRLTGRKIHLTKWRAAVFLLNQKNHVLEAVIESRLKKEMEVNLSFKKTKSITYQKKHFDPVRKVTPKVIELDALTSLVFFEQAEKIRPHFFSIFIADLQMFACMLDDGSEEKRLAENLLDRMFFFHQMRITELFVTSPAVLDRIVTILKG